MTDPANADASATLTVTINGVSSHFPVNVTVADVVVYLALVGKRIAVERNQEIVPKSQYATTTLADGDALEIVHAIGGG